jgi:HEAT repeat protein
MGLRKTTAFDPLREVVERGHARDMPGLLKQLGEGDAEQRRWAARDLGAHPAAAAALGQRLSAETDPGVREALFVGLGTMASEAAAAALLPLLRSEDAALRNGAIESLGAMPGAVAPRIKALLADGDSDVRLLTVNLLGELRHEQVPAWLLQVLQRDPHVNVVAAALEVMAEAGRPEHQTALQAVRQRFPDDAFIDFAVDMALQRMSAP